MATDGSLKDDGRMGAAFVSMGDRILARSVAVFGSACSTRPELTAIALALEESLPREDLTILTDSLVAMTALFSLRRADFPLSLHHNACRQLLTHIVNLLNQRCVAGVVTRFVKVKAHCGEPLNEAADALASAAAEGVDSPMAGELHLEPDAVHFYVDDCPVEWDTRVRNHLANLAAGQVMATLSTPKTRRDGTVEAVPITTAWLLPQGQGRRVLGQALKAMKTNAAKRRVLQTIAGTFPGNALLCRWKLRPTATCDLCACPAETQAHKLQWTKPSTGGPSSSPHREGAGPPSTLGGGV